MDTITMRDLVEKRLEFHLSDKWNRKKLQYYLGKEKYSLDRSAINTNLREPMRDFVMRGGKRIRPVLFLAAVDLFGGLPRNYLDIAVAIEMLHNGTLVLDDIEDEAELRRGKPSCHKKFGLDTATNVGGSMYVLPLKIILNSTSNYSDFQKKRLIDIYVEEITNVSFGQAMDIYWHKNHPADINVEEYLEMVRLKTGSLMRMSTRMACAVTNRTKETEELFSELAENLGVAFQIIDDCLDLDPPSDKFGKAFGNDITEGKLSLPVIYTLVNAPKVQGNRLATILQKHTKNKALIIEAIKIIEDNDSIKESRQFAKRIVLDSWTEMEKKWARRNNLSNLRKLALFFVERDH